MATTNRNASSEVTFSIIQHVGVLESRNDAWTKEVNIVSWNGNQPKLDIRDWDPSKERMSRGITLTTEQGARLMEALTKFYQ